MLILSQSPTGVLSRGKPYYDLPSPPTFAHPDPPFFFPKRESRFTPQSRRRILNLSLASADGRGGGGDLGSAIKQSPAAASSAPDPPLGDEETLFVGQEGVPLEGVIQFDKPSSYSRLKKWGRVGLLAGGDVLALLLFSAIGRFSHGFSVFDVETLRTADPFVAGWFLSAYLLGGYGEDGRGTNGLTKGVLAATKSWSLGILLGIIIRAAATGHLPPYSFITVTMGSTAVLLIGWRALLLNIFPNDNGKRNDVYKRGSPFEFFELLASLVRRW